MVLSDRMEAIVRMVSPAEVLADIGTDHGYVPIALVERGVVKHVIAADVRPGPLSHASRSIRQAGLERQIETRLSDGLSAISPREADAIVIAGMGGALVMRILKEGREAAQYARELILQPQSEIAEVRRFLIREGYEILDEDMLCEDGKYYTVIKSAWKRQAASDYEGAGYVKPSVEAGGVNEDIIRLSAEAEDVNEDSMRLSAEADMAYGPILIMRSHPILKKYLKKEALQLQKITDSIPIEKATPQAMQRREEIAHMQAVNKYARLLLFGRS